MTKSRSIHVGCLVMKIGGGKNGTFLQKEYQSFIEHNGLEWTCTRSKAIWNAALLLADDEPEKARKVYQDNSIAYCKHTLLPKGAAGVAVKQFLEARRPSVVRRKSAVLRFYTCTQLPEGTLISPKQAKKALSAISDKPQCSFDSNIEVRAGFTDLTPNEILESCVSCLRDRCTPVKGKLGRPFNARDRDGRRLRALSYYYSPYELPKELRGKPYSHMVNSLNSTEWVPECLDKDTPCFEMRQELRSRGVSDKFVGRIFPIQEQGCKARVVAQPNAWLQLACAPYHDAIARITDEIFPRENDVLHQESGAWAALNLMDRGFAPTCVDLRSATDRFPRKITEALICELGYPEYAQAMEEISLRDWECSFAPGCSVTYGCGQPMGLYGSFPSFNLSNLCLAETSVRLARKGGFIPTAFPGGEYYHVVGDDIEFSDSIVADTYKSLLSTLGVSISEEKSFKGGSIAEFAGFIIRKLGDTGMVFRPFKIPTEMWKINSIEFLHAMGSAVLNLKRKTYWAQNFYAYSATLNSRDIALSPLVPSDRDELRGSNRATTADLINLSRGLGFALLDRGLTEGEILKFYPLIGDRDTRINSVPFFLEDGALITTRSFFNPDLFTEKDDVPKFRKKHRQNRLKLDPLISMMLTSLRERNGYIQSKNSDCKLCHNGKCDCFRKETKVCFSGNIIV